MDFKQVYLYNGTPFLAFKNEGGEYQYPEESWTEVTPPNGIYSPFYFNGNEWIGTSKEEWESSLPVDPPYPIDTVEDPKNAEIDDMKSRIEELERLIQQLLEDTV